MDIDMERTPIEGPRRLCSLLVPWTDLQRLPPASSSVVLRSWIPRRFPAILVSAYPHLCFSPFGLMDSEINCLGASLSLAEDEESGMRSFHPDVMQSTLQTAFNPVKGMEFQLIEGDRFLLKFFHSIDRQRVLANCPWVKMTIDVATTIGNRLGHTGDVDQDKNGAVWGSSVRIRASIDITKPLKRALKIRIIFRDEQLVTFTYERLPNFCYLCGYLNHI
ncbi:hypothetical protein Salat_2137500 [Sesamum alatum]|uniref:Zinc knuckle CX2CX4HX4C domain-containing protein n=1 Tax=Sesamum alatum TaxID=300844 RepID=A0AAE1Y1E0_9LAMI|nr:hypothetical protein Salat_2137500 [Sesamum alatum]